MILGTLFCNTAVELCIPEIAFRDPRSHQGISNSLQEGSQNTLKVLINHKTGHECHRKSLLGLLALAVTATLKISHRLSQQPLLYHFLQYRYASQASYHVPAVNGTISSQDSP